MRGLGDSGEDGGTAEESTVSREPVDRGSVGLRLDRMDWMYIVYVRNVYSM